MKLSFQQDKNDCVLMVTLDFERFKEVQCVWKR